MEEEPEEHFDEVTMAEAAERFQKMLKKKEQPFFSEDIFLDLHFYYLDQDKVDLSLKVCNAGLVIYPHSVELLICKAQLLTEQLMLEEAAEVLDTAHIFNPNEPRIPYCQALLALYGGRYEEAIELFLSVEHDCQEIDNLYMHLGLCYGYLDKGNEAIEYLQKGCLINNTNQYLYIETCYAFEENQKLQAGIKFFNGLIEKDPYNYLAWHGVGFLQSSSANETDALYAYEMATAINDTFEPSLFGQGEIYLNQEQYEKAKEAFSIASKLSENPDVFTHLAASYEHLEDYPNAFKYYKKATELDEFFDDAWYGLGSILYEQDKYIEAIHYVNKAIKINNIQPDYYCLLGDCESKLGNIVSADEAYRHAIELDSLSGDIWLNWSLLYHEDQNYIRAYEIVKDAMDELPFEADLYYRACVYLMYNGQFKEAYTYLTEALSIDYDKHVQLYDFFSKLDTLKALQKIIDQYRP